MNEHLLEPTRMRAAAIPPRRRQRIADEHLLLNELDPDAVIDHLDSPSEAIELMTFGAVRETCPRCQQAHLKLVLRQRRVRLAHLFCEQCLGCYDASYPNGTPALCL